MTLMVYKYNAEEITKIYEKRYILKQKIYKLFVSQCKNIEELSWNDSQPLSFFPRTSRLNSLINAERNLKEVLIYNNRKFDCKELIKALEKNDTITKLLLSSVSIIIPSIITSLINLKIGSNNVHDEDNEIIRQKIAISEFPDLQILNLKEIS
ncbi:uncharacterized protein OCT59_016268 [Rhizophagus irregularis]|uniref:Uncharacterized protein n=1 Tax=Rhizophagus irregularis TaxID=588596 RepID=A0A915YPF2_9GLOM|nr:hypothetical protein OCT59_016268 [Rhizophagus irregularis]CAB5303579.1 unnamed protein product [Rhizophagus irregularis]